jgi:hypothetical protein
VVSRRTRNRSPDVGQSSRVIEANDDMADLYTEIRSTQGTKVGHFARVSSVLPTRPCFLPRHCKRFLFVLIGQEGFGRRCHLRDTIYGARKPVRSRRLEISEQQVGQSS